MTMKTVEQWMQGKRDALSSDLSCQAWIQAIQLDAKRCGMTHAIMIVNNHSRRAGATDSGWRTPSVNRYPMRNSMCQLYLYATQATPYEKESIPAAKALAVPSQRSEERRVGAEC